MIRPPGEEARRVAHDIWNGMPYGCGYSHFVNYMGDKLQPYLEDIATLRADMNVIMEHSANLTEALEAAREALERLEEYNIGELRDIASFALSRIAVIVAAKEPT